MNDQLHSESISDPYRWLEDGEAAEVKTWTRLQNAFTEKYLACVPVRGEVRRRLRQLLAIGALSAPRPARGRYFYQRRDRGQNQAVLYVRDGRDGPDRTLIDPNALNPEGTTTLDWFYPSDDGRLLAFGLSENDTADSELRLLDVSTGVALGDRIPQTRSCVAAWLPDASGFYYTRYPRPGEVPDAETHCHRALYFHRLGTDPDDDAEIFRPRAKEHWPGVDLSPDGRWLIVSVARTFDQSDIWLQDRALDGPLVPVVQDLPFAFDVRIVDGHLYIRTNLDAPHYRLFVADAVRPEREHWREVVPASVEAVLHDVLITRCHLVLSYQERASSRLRLAGRLGEDPRDIPLPTIGSVFGWGAEPDGDELFYGFFSYTTPPSVYRIDLTDGTSALWQRVQADLDPAAYVVRQEEYHSKDGTPISLFLAHGRDLVRNGSTPTYLTGYGGFAISMTPGFSRSLLLWLEHGGLIAVPNLRGGGEYGEAWHQAGMLGKKQNTFDDFISAAEYLIAQRYTAPRHLAIAGASNGGLLVGAVVTQRPDLFRAAVIQVPLLDMLRYHLFLEARLWIREYGAADDREQFSWLRAYSPYHRVTEGTAYPAMLLAAAERDTRVDPLHARKMAARLQAATASARPVLLRVEPRAARGGGTPDSMVLEELSDTWTFLLAELGLAG